MAITFGKVPRPPIIQKIVPRSIRGSAGPGNQAWDNLGQRRLVGTCVHRMEGTLNGTYEYFCGDGRFRALTDYGIGGVLDGNLDGVIHQYIEDGAAVAPWANGGSDGLEGDGPAFVQAYGITGINRDIRSIELSGLQNTPVSEKQLDALAALVAYLHDQANVPWDSFPIHPISGVVTQMQHWEFATKACPFGVVRDLTDEYQNRARAIMKRHQTGAAETNQPPAKPTPPPTPTKPKVPWGSEADIAFAERHFGRVAKVTADGKWLSSETGFDPKGTISNAWLERAHREGAFPEAVRWTVYPVASIPGATAEEVVFANGWVLVKTSGDGINAGWHWAGDEYAAAKSV